jgi:hypothetical protein
MDKNNMFPIYLNNKQINLLKGKFNNIDNYYRYITQFTENVLSIFEWENLPKEIPNYILEEYLMRYGCICLYQKDFIDTVSLETYKEWVVRPYTIIRYNDYWQPIEIQTISITSESDTLFSDKFTFCYNNKSGVPTFSYAIWFANKMNEIETSINIAVKQLRIPYLFEGTQPSKKAFDELFKKIEKGNTHYYVISDNFFNERGAVKHDLLNTNAVQRIESLYMLKEKYMQEWYTLIGAHTNLNNKNERLTENESLGYNEIGNFNIAGMLQMRKSFCRDCRNKFGLDIDVHFSRLIRDKIQKETGLTENDFLEFYGGDNYADD